MSDHDDQSDHMLRTCLESWAHPLTCIYCNRTMTALESWRTRFVDSSAVMECHGPLCMRLGAP